MCISATQNVLFHTIQSSKNRRSLKRSKLQVLSLTRRRCDKKLGKDIELKNLQLYLENQTIIEENEKLREKAHILHQENLALLTEFQKNSHIWNRESDGNHQRVKLFYLSLGRVRSSE